MAASDRPGGKDPNVPAAPASSEVKAAPQIRRPASGVFDREQITEALLNHAVLEAVTEGVMVVGRDGRLRFANQLLLQLFGMPPDRIAPGREARLLLEEVGSMLANADEMNEATARMISGELSEWAGEVRFRDGRLLETHARNLFEDGRRIGRIWLFRDITAARQAATALLASEAQQREVIAEQRRLIETIREMGTPVLPIYDKVLVLPLVGHIDADRSEHIMDALLDAIQRYQAQVVIMDITGVTLVDTSVADSLIKATRAAGLIGSKCVLVGVSAQVARTLVLLGIDLAAVVTRRDLQAGIAYALAQVGCKIVVEHVEPDWLSLDEAGELTRNE